MAKKIIITEEQAKGIIAEGIVDSLISAYGGQYNPAQIISLLQQLLPGQAINAGNPNTMNYNNLIKKIYNILNKKQGQEDKSAEQQMANNTPSAGATTPSQNCLNTITKYEAVPDGKTVKTFGYQMVSKELNGYPGPEDKAAARDGRPYHKTYGYGLKFTPDGKKYMDQVQPSYTQQELENLFKQKVNKIASDALNYLRNNYGDVKLGQNQLDAIVCACYNFGLKGFFEKARAVCPNGMGPIIGNNPNDQRIPSIWAGMSNGKSFATALGKRRSEEAQLYAQDIPAFQQYGPELPQNQPVA